ncbi:MAG: CPBP family intramembrane glutamic endopeptidase [Myxococcota bacterium]
MVGWIEQAREVPRHWRELAAVAATGALHLTWPTDWSRGWWVVPVVLAWVAHVAVTARRDPEALAGWGLRRDGLLPTSLAVGAVSLVAGAGMLAWGASTGATYGWTFALALVSYPLWGLVQQLLVQGVVTGNLARLPIPGAPYVAALGSAVVFGVVHAAEPVLVVATFGMGLVFAPIWLRWRNLWPLGLAHGWLGAIVYFAVLHQDPLGAYLLGP